MSVCAGASAVRTEETKDSLGGEASKTRKATRNARTEVPNSLCVSLVVTNERFSASVADTGERLG
jgi:hypothetical protein